MKKTFTRLTLGLLAAGALSVVAHAEVKVFQNFTLVDSVKGVATPAQAMIVDNGKIRWVGPLAKLKTPERSIIEDLSGKYVMPGLIDLHVHLGTVRDLTQTAEFYTKQSVETDLRRYAAYGVTTVQSLGTDKDLIFDIMKQRTGRPTYSRVYSAGQGLVYCTPLATCATGANTQPVVGGYGGIYPGISHPIDNAADAVKEVDAQADKGADFIKLWVDDELGTLPKMPPEIRKAIIDEAHKRGLRAIAHVFYLEDAKNLVSLGIDGFAHMVRDKPADDELIAAMKAKGTWQMVGTLSREASMFAFGERPPFLDDPFFKQSLSPKALELIESAERRKTVAGGPNYQNYMRFHANAVQSFKRFADAGVKYGFGTDSGPPARFGGYFDHWELEEMVAAGFTPAQALTAATRNAAEFLRAKDIGAIAPGRWADLLVLDANPLVDIRNTHKIAAVYLAGSKAPSVRR